ncbi:arginine repressor [Vagococcus fluvialis]|uniref:arginine repressor n=1 Tax=Vagococcus fluvialis TaxID=2738 RepID=UPI001432BB2E|nr:ArgR family transcriptional regulator [Vagococcus fluvialis]MBO0487729.1 ArgR family transcriptional regulator [Vagococcus fluvialis]MCM2138137.1 ArgR family transcriptional regulator [Vagococcus fluvialis]NKC60648.1 ArgR family transcriptional regulator [Vagococcus fluvialis]NKD51496.1 ArgR family transcriptional regulator [Vagococcus fluvialis]
MRKQERQRFISKIIRENEVFKQEDLVALLIEKNIPVTQATVSRDIKEMKLIKVLNENGILKYGLPQNDNSASGRLNKLLKKSFIDLKRMDKMVSIITKPGSGFALGGLIETVYPEYLFTVMANDDKILIFMETEEAASDMEDKIYGILK